MELGSSEHKQQHIDELTKAYYENIWKDEIEILEFETLLGILRTQKAEIELKLERKEYPKANDGKKELARNEDDIEATQAAIARLQDKKATWIKRIELLKRYAEQDGQTN